MEKSKRGFAAWDKERLREVAKKGGESAHQLGTAHEFTSEEARKAGRKGGMATGRRRKRNQLSLPFPPESEVRLKEEAP